MLIFMQLSTQLYIDGKWVNGASTMPVTDPSDESVIANVQISSEEQCIEAYCDGVIFSAMDIIPRCITLVG